MSDLVESWHYVPVEEDYQTGLAIESVGHFHIHRGGTYDRVRSDYLLVLCLEGKGTLGKGADARTIKPQTAFITFPDVPHTYYCDPREGWQIRWCHFYGGLAEQLVALAGFSPACPVQHIDDTTDAVFRFRQLAELLRNKPMHFNLDLAATLYALLVGLRKCVQTQAVRDSGVEAAMQIDPRDVDEMAAAASMSKFHFIRRFREATGTTPWRYITNRRMSRAKDLLSRTDLRVCEVATRVGYDDPNYFSRLFRQETGCSPRQFRRTLPTVDLSQPR